MMFRNSKNKTLYFLNFRTKTYYDNKTVLIDGMSKNHK
jgi:hypothetical protein